MSAHCAPPARTSPRAGPAFAAPAHAAVLTRQRPALCPARRARTTRAEPAMHFLEAAHSAPEFVVHVAASCGAALFGVLGARATRGPRALLTARFAAERRTAAEQRHLRRLRREELSEGARLGVARNWGDVDVDAVDNVIVRLPPVQANTAFPASPHLADFDSALGAAPSPAATHPLRAALDGAGTPAAPAAPKASPLPRAAPRAPATRGTPPPEEFLDLDPPAK